MNETLSLLLDVTQSSQEADVETWSQRRYNKWNDNTMCILKAGIKAGWPGAPGGLNRLSIWLSVLAQVVISRFVCWSPASRSPPPALPRAEPAWNSLSPLRPSPPPPTPPLCALSLSLNVNQLKKFFKRGAWVAQSVKHPTSAQVMILGFVGSSPTSGYVLTAQSLEPASHFVSPPLSAPPMLMLCLSIRHKR